MTFPANWTDVGATGDVDDPSTQWRMVAVEDSADPRRNVWVASWYSKGNMLVHMRGGREGDDMAVAARFANGEVEFFDWLNNQYATADTVLMELLERLAQCREVLGPASPPPVSSDVVKNMLNQIEAFSTAMRRTWGEP